jgi:hypothetical protein
MAIAKLGRDASPARSPDETPTLTKIALVATVVVTICALAAFAIERGDPVSSRFCASFLTLFSAFFLIRVGGQLVVVGWRPKWLPPAAKWNLMPYRLLLPAQLVILGVMAWIATAFWVGSGLPLRREHVLGDALLWFAVAYAGSMAVRYVVRMIRRPEERWFGGRSRSSSTGCSPRILSCSDRSMSPSEATRETARAAARAG